MERAERSNSARLDRIADAQVRMSNSFDVLVRHLCESQVNRAPPIQYNTVPTQSFTPPPSTHSYTPSHVGSAHSNTPFPVGFPHSYTAHTTAPTRSYTSLSTIPAQSHSVQPMGPAPQSYRQLLEEPSQEQEDLDVGSW